MRKAISLIRFRDQKKKRENGIYEILLLLKEKDCKMYGFVEYTY